jgi:hypothetical protein
MQLMLANYTPGAGALDGTQKFKNPNLIGPIFDLLQAAGRSAFPYTE